MRHNRRLRWAAIPIAASLSLVLAGCTQAQLNGFLPGFVEGEPPVTNHTEVVSGLWVTSWIVLLVVGIITWGLTIWAAIAYRRRKGQTGLPVQLRYNMPIEIFYTIVPLILVLGFFAFTARDQQILESAAEDHDVQVEVIGKQWAWDFNYVKEDVYSPGDPGPGLRRRPTAIVDADRSSPRSTCPSARMSRSSSQSRDVIHSFWVMDFLYKKDMFPGETNYMSFVPDARRHLRRQVRRAVRRVPLADAVQRRGGLARPSTRTTSSRCATLGQEGQLSSEYDRSQNLPGTGAPELKRKRNR